jgi:Ca2+-binding EF-hand superfamily protein
MSELTKDEIDDLRASFEMFDCDKSGKLRISITYASSSFLVL